MGITFRAPQIGTLCRPLEGRLVKSASIRFRVDRGTALVSGSFFVSVFPPIADDNPGIPGLPQSASIPLQRVQRDVPGNAPDDQQVVDDEATFNLEAGRTYRTRIEFVQVGHEFPNAVEEKVVVPPCDCSLVEKHLDRTTIKVVDQSGTDVTAEWHDGLCINSDSVTVTVTPPRDVPFRWLDPVSGGTTTTLKIDLPSGTAANRTTSATFEVGYAGCAETRRIEVERCETIIEDQKQPGICSVVDCRWSLSVWKISVIVACLAFYLGMSLTVFHGARAGILGAASETATQAAATLAATATSSQGSTSAQAAQAAVQAVNFKIGAIFDLTIAIVGVVCLILFACAIVLGALTCWLWWACCGADWCRMNSNLEWSLQIVVGLSAILGIVVAAIEFLFVAPRMASEPGSAAATAAAMGVFLALMWGVFIYFQSQVRAARQQGGCRELRLIDPPWEG